MGTPLDVLLIESHPGVATSRAEELEVAGHRVHRCWAPTVERGHADDGREPCTGVTGSGCPIDAGVDVALLVRRGVSPRVRVTESGVGCAIRAGVPVVEDGAVALDPFGPYIARRAGTDVARACEQAVDEVWSQVEATLRRTTAHLLAEEGIDPEDVHLRAEVTDDALVVRIEGPAMGPRLRQALAVRAADALRELPHRSERVDISCDEAPPGP